MLVSWDKITTGSFFDVRMKYDGPIGALDSFLIIDPMTDPNSPNPPTVGSLLQNRSTGAFISGQMADRTIVNVKAIKTVLTRNDLVFMDHVGLMLVAQVDANSATFTANDVGVPGATWYATSEVKKVGHYAYFEED